MGKYTVHWNTLKLKQTITLSADKSKHDSIKRGIRRAAESDRLFILSCMEQEKTFAINYGSLEDRIIITLTYRAGTSFRTRSALDILNNRKGRSDISEISRRLLKRS